MTLRNARSPVREHRFPDSVTVLVCPDDRPVVDPPHGLQMHYPAVSSFFLEMDEPVPARLCRYPCALVGSVDCCISLMKYCFYLVGSVDVFRTQCQLPPVCYSAGRCKNVIVSVSFIKFWSLNSRLII